MLYLSQFLLARMMKVDQYGIYVFGLSWSELLMLIGTVGMDSAALRFIPQYSSQRQLGYSRGYIRRSFQIIVPVSVFLAICAWGIILAAQARFPAGNMERVLMIAMVMLPLRTAIRMIQGILQADKRPGRAQFLDGVLAPILLLTILGLAVALNIPVTASLAMAVFIAACLIVLALGIIWLRRYLMTAEMAASRAEYSTREWLGFALPMLMIVGIFVIISNTDVIMIGMMKDAAQAGVYSAAARLAGLVSISLVFVNMALTPYISEYFYNGRRSDLQHFISLSARIAVLFAVPISLLLLFYGRLVLGLFGDGFRAGYPALVILIIGQLVNVLSGSVGIIMKLTGRYRQAVYVLAGSAVLNIILNLVLIPRFGIVGAAVATAIAMVAWNILMAVYIRNRLKINSTIFSLFNPTADRLDDSGRSG